MRSSIRGRGILLGIAIASCALALGGKSVVTHVSELYPLGATGRPYFQPGHWGLLYVAAPAVVVGSFIVFLLPGLLLAAGFRRSLSASEWLIEAFGTSVGLTIVLGTAAKLALGVPLSGSFYLALWLVVSLAAGALATARVRTASTLAGAGATPDWRRLLAPLVVAFLCVAVLVPKLFWENFNLDGIEAFEFGRSLERHLVPHWEIRDGVFGFYHNFVLFAFVNHWFTSLFGDVEAAARLPFLLYLVLLFPVLTLLIEHASPRKLSPREEGALWLGLMLYALIQVYDTNYEPFYADIAEMAATDTLSLLCFLAACWALWTGRWGWFAAFGIMTYVATPGGLLLLGGLALAGFLDRSAEGKRRWAMVAGVLAVCVALGVLYELAYRPPGLDAAINQFSAKNMLRRLFPPTLDHVGRFTALIFPSGVLPALSLLAIKRLDRYARMMAGITIVYFAVIYAQTWTSLHQFTPVMVTPLVVFWRMYASSEVRLQRWLLPSVVATTAVSMVLSAPPHFRINLGVRELGQATAYRIGDYGANYHEAASAVWSLDALLPSGYRMDYPNQPWGADGYAWLYYALRPKPAGAQVNYIVQRSHEPAPEGATRIMDEKNVSVYVHDLDALERERARAFPRVAASRLYEHILRDSYAFFRRFMESNPIE